MINQQQPLTNQQLERYVPSAFAVEPWGGMSARYRLIPTISVIEHLREHGFMPMFASQGRTRIPGKADYTRHVIRFRQQGQALAVGDTFPEIVLSNSHDGTSAYKVLLGMFRLVCLNGMTVSSSNINEINVRHSGSEHLAGEVLDASYRVIEQAPTAVRQIEDWSSHTLSRPQQLAYAEAALELSDHSLKPTAEQVIRPRRYGDNGSDIWSTLNVVQENLIRGGQLTRNANGQRRHVRAIHSVNEDLRLNRALWRLTEALNEQLH